MVGSPQPAGTPRATTSTTPPTESRASRARSIDLGHHGRGRRVGAAHRVALDLVPVARVGLTSPTRTVPPTMFTPHRARARARERAGRHPAHRLAPR